MINRELSPEKGALVSAAAQATIDTTPCYNVGAAILASYLYDQNPERANSEPVHNFTKKILSILDIDYYIDCYSYDMSIYGGIIWRLTDQSDEASNFGDNFLSELEKSMAMFREDPHNGQYASDFLDIVAEGCKTNHDKMPKNALIDEWEYIINSPSQLPDEQILRLHTLVFEEIYSNIERGIGKLREERQKLIDGFYFEESKR